jgi:dihydrodipicolinate reductase
VVAAPDLTLGGAVAHSAAGQDLGTAWGREPVGVVIAADVDQALDEVDVLVDYPASERGCVHKVNIRC